MRQETRDGSRTKRPSFPIPGVGGFLRRCEGLTLTEILVVMLVIAVLASLLLPALSVARSHARQTVCGSNLRQMGMAFSLYAMDWRNVLPHEDASIPDKTAAQCGVDLPALCDPNPDCPYCWFYALDQYLTRQNADRLAEVKQDPIFRKIAGERKATTRTIKMNTSLEPDTNCNPRFRDIAGISQPGETVLLFDGRTDNQNVASAYEGAVGSVDQRHSGGANFLFVSGRVAWVVEGDQAALIWTP
jgi:prepilin-type N-terminal cleavage/methylation domain-containing protein